MRVVAILLVWWASFVRTAVNPIGTQAVAAIIEDDAFLISDHNTYYPDQHDCPLPCVDYSNMNTWIPYLSVDRLHSCQEPMLLQFSVTQPLDDPASNIFIRSCSLESHPAVGLNATATIENPKQTRYVFQNNVDSAPACATVGREGHDNLELLTSSDGKGYSGEVAYLLEGMQKFFDTPDNCDETFLFAYHKQTVVGIFIGAGLGKSTIESAIKALDDRLRTTGSISNHTIAQLCGSDRIPERVFGISISTTNDLATVQKTALEWSKGNCAPNGDLRPGGLLSKVKVWDIVADYYSLIHNETSPASSPLRKSSYRSDLLAAPKPNPDGTCASHLIQSGDSCDKLAKQYTVTIADLEKWNKGKTWAWTECKDMLIGYSMCISDGLALLPPPQIGTQCGPVVPGTKRSVLNRLNSLADLNPCPLKACCSNWGYCGVFPAHCDVHAPKGGGPGTKEKGYQSTCISNCGSEIKKNGPPPQTFQRIGYYESFSLERSCLWLKAKNANTDGSYTHIHWGFGDIDSKTWKPVIKDPNQQWGDFKALSNVKRIVSFGGWAYSTEPATYDIIRSAIIKNGDTFARNLAQFVKDEGIDGIDIDWEYPGAPDILVNGQPIGQKGDGLAYLRFLKVLKENLGPDKSVSIAAPASYWYLRAFPIDRIASVIDYIVYMTYDLHGQWDYGNPNSFDSCPSGKCIRSHVNLTETRNSLAMITKAGVPNNKIFVGESSYGRSFHMALNGCWGPMCDFTGSKTKSDSKPGRCTKEGGYLAYAEITEIIKRGESTRTFHDAGSNTDVMLYKGDYVSYMTPATKDLRREEWKKLNFGGSIDWAVDLQSFTADDLNSSPNRPKSGNGCVSGVDDSVNSGDLCEFSCTFGFCPESLCTCRSTGRLRNLPPERPVDDVIAWDELDVDLNRLCKFACKYGYCPDDVCTTFETEEPEPTVFSESYAYNTSDIRRQNWERCIIYRNPEYRSVSLSQCKEVCQHAIDEANREERTSNWGCLPFFPLDQPIPWAEIPGTPYGDVVSGKCFCNNWLVSELADSFLEALPALAQTECYVLMSSFKLVLDVGVKFIPVVGRPLDAGLDMLTVAAQMAAYVYPDEEDPEGAFSWWLRGCGGTNLVPEDVKKTFDMLSKVATDISSFKTPKKIKKGSGKKGDRGNPKDQSKPPSAPARGNECKNPGPKQPQGSIPAKNMHLMMPCIRKKGCKIPADKRVQRLGAARNTLRVRSCVNEQTMTKEMIITSAAYAADAKPTRVAKKCEGAWSQACYHYSSAIRVNKHWATLTCPPEAATTRKHRLDGPATASWSKQHRGEGWIDSNKECDRDEYPPAYLLNSNDQAYIAGGVNSQGQLVRYIPADQNRKAGQMWKAACFKGPIHDLTDQEFENKVSRAAKKHVIKQNQLEQTMAAVTVNSRPEFTISSWGQAGLPDDGLRANDCWPSDIAAEDPGFALLTFDPHYGGKKPPYNYSAKYEKGKNGS